MLRTNGSNEYIAPVKQVEEMEALLGEFWNSSISWTEQQGAWMELSFVGTDIWAYGIDGPEYGDIEFTLDGRKMEHGDEGSSQDSEEQDYHHLLLDLHELENGEHTLRYTNAGAEGAGKRMSFDYAVIQGQSSPISEKNDASAIASLTNTPALAAQVTSPLTSTDRTTISTSFSHSTSTPNPNSTSTSNDSSPQLQEGVIQAQAQAQAAAASSAALAALFPTQYSMAQLASLKEVYTFRWNAAAYFVVVFASCVVGVFLLFIVHISLKAYIKDHRPEDPYMDGCEQGGSSKTQGSPLTTTTRTTSTQGMEAIKQPKDSGNYVGPPF
ncbi:uncharacterized protein I303_105120 [Kwoniella dejecticola CBS 10117]